MQCSVCVPKSIFTTGIDRGVRVGFWQQWEALVDRWRLWVGGGVVVVLLVEVVLNGWGGEREREELGWGERGGFFFCCCSTF